MFVVSGDQLRLGSRWRERGHGKRRRDGQLPAYPGCGASRLGQVLVQPIERRRLERGRACPERYVKKYIINIFFIISF